MTALVFAIAVSTLVIGAAIGAAIAWRACRQMDTSYAFQSGYELGHLDGERDTAERIDQAMHRIAEEGP